MSGRWDSVSVHVTHLVYRSRHCSRLTVMNLVKSDASENAGTITEAPTKMGCTRSDQLSMLNEHTNISFSSPGAYSCSLLSQVMPV